MPADPNVTLTTSTSFLARVKRKLLAAWGGRAKIRRNLAIALADAVALTAAFQLAFPEVGVEHSAVFSAVTRMLTGSGVWLASRAMLRITGESNDEPA
jgi:hypothetical protein